jgi:hypothetical protein
MPKIRTITITCPECKTILVVNRDTGEIFEVRKPLVDDPSGDRFADALRAHKEHTDKLGSIFENSIADVSRQDEERRKLFKESLEKVQDDDIDDLKEIRDIDLD